MQLLIQLRWLAVAGQVLAIYAVEWVLEVRLPLLLMLAAPAALIAVNLLSMARIRISANVSGIELFVALMADVAALIAGVTAANPADVAAHLLKPEVKTLGF